MQTNLCDAKHNATATFTFNSPNSRNVKSIAQSNLWVAKHNATSTFTSNSRNPRNVQSIARSNLWDVNTMQLRLSRLVAVTHETSSPQREQDANTMQLRHSGLVVVAHETSSPLRRATYGMQNSLFYLTSKSACTSKSPYVICSHICK